MKLNIYLTDRLAKRLTKVKVNKSLAACNGIEIMLAIIAAGKRVLTKEDVIDRLRGERILSELRERYDNNIKKKSKNNEERND